MRRCCVRIVFLTVCASCALLAMMGDQFDGDGNKPNSGRDGYNGQGFNGGPGYCGSNSDGGSYSGNFVIRCHRAHLDSVPSTERLNQE
jgi:uncharacterized membrane protein